MAVNLLKLFTDEIGGQVAHHASTLLNEPRENTDKALSGILPTLLGSVSQKGTTKSGAEELLGAITEHGFDGGLLDSIGDLFGSSGGPDLDGVLKQGGGLLDALIGGKQSSLIDMIANWAGVRKSSTGSLLKLAAPLLISLIGRRVKSQGLDLAGLMNMLSGQSSFIKSSMPSGLSGIGNLLGFKGDLADLGDEVAEAVDKVGDSARRTASAATTSATNTLQQGSRNKWLPWLIGALALILVIYYLIPSGSEAETAVQEATETVRDMAQDAGTAVASAADRVGAKIDQMLEEGEDLVDETFTFANSDFNEGSATLSENLREEIMGLAETMQDNPDLVVLITAFAPSSQDLANQRALAVKQLMNNEGGVAPDRIQTAGQVATSGDPDRVELKITDR